LNFLFGDAAAAASVDDLGEFTFDFVWCERRCSDLVGEEDKDTLGDGKALVVEEEEEVVVDKVVPFEWKNNFGVPLLF
jgi:hypothetical protein